ncbi:hypothetical protein [Jiangella rhizosphaerae]|uniref:Uncharacterized protein n=1 Tax=Jiangella rhizosphaerae TaxID=2293569 RepID=A0A418KK82_9ACTN|nr:hypothetical protein [Jiangella rhizosphaerae]RIQ16108.1 hypothetical protein DY240_23075 [Jiangella rhizosphaerae]
MAVSWRGPFLLSGAVGVPLCLAGYQLLGPVIAAGRPAGLQYWGWAVSAFVLGMLAGSLVALRWRPRRPMLATVSVLLAWPLPLAVLALDVHLASVLLPMAVSGLALDLFAVRDIRTLTWHPEPEGHKVER